MSPCFCLSGDRLPVVTFPRSCSCVCKRTRVGRAACGSERVAVGRLVFVVCFIYSSCALTHSRSLLNTNTINAQRLFNCLCELVSDVPAGQNVMKLRM